MKNQTEKEKLSKVLVCGDLHGKHEVIPRLRKQFITKEYDQIVLLGDYVDSFTHSDLDILTTLRSVIDLKEEYPDNVILLLGNHDMHYKEMGKYLCSGYRVGIAPALHQMYKDYHHLFQIAYQYKDHLFTHAGVQKKWFVKHYEKINYYGKLLQTENLAEIFNAINCSKDQYILHEVGTIRGGLRYDYGGITWCDEREIMGYNPIAGVHQVVGHTPQKFIKKENRFNGSHYNNTSVTFCDVLDKSDGAFLTLNI